MASVSVVVIARNEANRITSCVRSILSTGYPDLEIILIDDGSGDGTAAAAKEVGGATVKVLQNPVPEGPAASRNQGIRAARGEFVFFLDADCVVESNWIRDGLAPMSEPEVVAVEGAIHYERLTPAFYDKVPVNPFYNLDTRGSLTASHRDYCSGNLAVRRSALLALGGFNTGRYPDGREDTDLGRRLSGIGKICYEQRMVAVHAAETWSLRSLLSNCRRYGADVVFCKDHGDFQFRRGVFLHPRLLAMLLFPPLILLRFRPNSLRSWGFIGSFYLYLLTLRLVIWRMAVRERIFLL